MTIPNGKDYFDLIFEATYGGGIFGNIGLDDIYYLPGGTCEYFNSTTTTTTTTTQPPPFALYGCSFESGFCQWYADPSNTSRWVLKKGSEAKYGTAPLNDHTLGNSVGQYAAVDSSSTAEFSIAVLKSPPIDFQQSKCLEFWYQLGGQADSSLTVAIRSAQKRTPQWNRLGNQADRWSHAYVNLQSNISSTQWIEFEGDVSNKLFSFVAIDDVLVLNGVCPSLQFCDFETEDICGYRHDVSADFDWLRNKINTDTETETGPSYDHTYQTELGHYMYIEASFSNYGEKARLITPKVTASPTGVCVTFWYHMFGATMGTLNVYTRKHQLLSEQPIWTMSGEQGNLWRTSSVTFRELEDFEVNKIFLYFLLILL